jgi:hypothetical protein
MAPTRRASRQLGLPGTAQASGQARPMRVLASPHVDRLLADPQLTDHISDAASGLNKI